MYTFEMYLPVYVDEFSEDYGDLTVNLEEAIKQAKSEKGNRYAYIKVYSVMKSTYLEFLDDVIPHENSGLTIEEIVDSLPDEEVFKSEYLSDYYFQYEPDSAYEMEVES